MEKLPKKKFEFKNYAVDVYVIDSFPEYAQSQSLLRPLRLTTEQSIGVVYKERVYPLGLNKDSRFAITLNGVSHAIKNTQLVQLPILKELQYIETPIKHISDELSWNIKRSQFGVYVYLTASDDAVERFVTILIEKYNLRVINWGVSSDLTEFLWRVKLSSGLSTSTVRAAVEDLVAHVATDLKAADSFIEEQKTSRKGKILNLGNSSVENSSTADLAKKEDELNLVYQELNKLIRENQKLSKLVEEPTHVSQGRILSAQSIKRGAAEKLLSNAIFTTLPNLAFAPEVIDELKLRFKDSKAIWYVLRQLNDGVSVPLTKLNNLAGKVGWFELRKHINTGADDRGRIYCRRSCKDHDFDVIIHWKKNDKDQQKLFRKIATYEQFVSPETIYM